MIVSAAYKEHVTDACLLSPLWVETTGAYYMHSSVCVCVCVCVCVISMCVHVCVCVIPECCTCICLLRLQL